MSSTASGSRAMKRFMSRMTRKTCGCEICVPDLVRITLIVLGPVGFDHQARLVGKEVRHIWSDRFLASEVHAHPLPTQEPPDDLLGGRELPPQSPGGRLRLWR